MFYQQKCMKKLCIFAVPVREDGVDLSLQYGDKRKARFFVPVREDEVGVSRECWDDPDTNSGSYNSCYSWRGFALVCLQL